MLTVQSLVLNIILISRSGLRVSLTYIMQAMLAGHDLDM